MWTIPVELKGSMLVYGLVALNALSSSSTLAIFFREAVLTIVLLQLGYWTMACFEAGLLLSYIDIFALDIRSTKCLAAGTQSIFFNAIFVLGYYFLCQPAHAGNPEYCLKTPGWRWPSLLTPTTYGAEQYYRYWHSLGAVLFIYAALRVSWLQRFFSTRALQYLGHVSFVLHLVHLPLLYILGESVRCASWWDNKLWIPDFGPAGFNSRFLASIGITSAICLPAADAATRLIDRPSVRLGKKITTRLGLENYKVIVLEEMQMTFQSRV